MEARNEWHVTADIAGLIWLNSMEIWASLCVACNYHWTVHFCSTFNIYKVQTNISSSPRSFWIMLLMKKQSIPTFIWSNLLTLHSVIHFHLYNQKYVIREEGTCVRKLNKKAVLTNPSSQSRVPWHIIKNIFLISMRFSACFFLSGNNSRRPSLMDEK